MKNELPRPTVIWISATDRMPNDDEVSEAPGGKFLCRVLVPNGKGAGYITYMVCPTDYDYGKPRHFCCTDGIVTHWTMIPAEPHN